MMTKSYEKEQWWIDTQKWINNIPKEIDSKKGSPPLPGWKVFEADSWHAAQDAAQDATQDAAWHAAWDAARDAAWHAAWDAARDAAWHAAWHAAWDAARNAARNAAWHAARHAARDAAWHAARDAALLASMKLCVGLKISKKHVKHAEERWEANKRGFRVLCDVDGVLYVYRKREVKN